MNITQHQSIAQWARSLGSNAKTHRGQRRVILNHISSMSPVWEKPLVYRGQWSDSYQLRDGRNWQSSATKSQYYHQRQIRHLEQLAADTERCRDFLRERGVVPRDEALDAWRQQHLDEKIPPLELWNDRMMQQYKRNERLIRKYQRSIFSKRDDKNALPEGLPNYGFCIYRLFEDGSDAHHDVLITADVYTNWERYGRRVYPIMAITRTAILLRPDWEMPSPLYGPTEMPIKTVNNVKNYKNALEKIVIELLDVPEDYTSGPLRLRRNKHFSIKPVDVPMVPCNIKVYKRLLGSIEWDYVADMPEFKTSYYGRTIDEAVKRLLKKEQDLVLSKAAKNVEWIDLDLCRKLGFCLTGVQQFCDMTGLDMEKAYPRHVIKSVLKQNPEVWLYFDQELNKLGFRQKLKKAV